MHQARTTFFGPLLDQLPKLMVAQVHLPFSVVSGMSLTFPPKWSASRLSLSSILNLAP